MSYIQDLALTLAFISFGGPQDTENGVWDRLSEDQRERAKRAATVAADSPTTILLHEARDYVAAVEDDGHAFRAGEPTRLLKRIDDHLVELASGEDGISNKVETYAREIARGCNLDPDAISAKAAEGGHSIPEWMFFVPAARRVIALEHA